MMKLGKAFRMARTRAGLRQNELAGRLQVSPTYISMLENDRRDPSWSFICRACEELKLPIPMLLLLAADTIDIAADQQGQRGRSIVQRELLAYFLAHESSTPKGDS
jgi:transcriptional regulator with XRE-family HTH domain